METNAFDIINDIVLLDNIRNNKTTQSGLAFYYDMYGNQPIYNRPDIYYNNNKVVFYHPLLDTPMKVKTTDNILVVLTNDISLIKRNMTSLVFDVQETVNHFNSAYHIAVIYRQITNPVVLNDFGILKMINCKETENMGCDIWEKCAYDKRACLRMHVLNRYDYYHPLFNLIDSNYYDGIKYRDGRNVKKSIYDGKQLDVRIFCTKYKTKYDSLKSEIYIEEEILNGFEKYMNNYFKTEL